MKQSLVSTYDGVTRRLYNLINPLTGKVIKQRYLSDDEVKFSGAPHIAGSAPVWVLAKARTFKHYRFYLEYPFAEDKRAASIRAGRLGNHTGCCVAVYEMKPGYLEGFASVRRGVPNGAVNWGGIGQEFLDTYCKRISAQLARAIHPHLFERLEQDDDS